MSNSAESYPEAKLLSTSNAQVWDLYLREHLIGHSFLGVAIITNNKFDLQEPTTDDVVKGTTKSCLLYTSDAADE